MSSLPILVQAAAGLLLGLLLLVLPSPHLVAAAAAQSSSKPGCPNACGNLTIPYPFGLVSRDDCYLTESRQFPIDCDMTVHPPIAYWQNKSHHIPITNISVYDHEMRIMVYLAYDCYNSTAATDWNNPSLKLARFPISSTKNTFTATGCDTKALLRGNKNGSYAIGCLSVCNDLADVTNGTCSGIGCCQASIPKNVMRYDIYLDQYANHSGVSEFNPCSYAFVAENGYFAFSTEYLLKSMADEMVPLIIDWSIGDQTCIDAQKNRSTYACKGENTTCTDAENGRGYRCHCKDGYKGSPYLSGSDGCQDIDECASSNPCNVTSLCINLPGTFNCSCPKGFAGDGKRDGNGNGCTPIIRSKKYTSRDITLGLGLGIGCGILFLFAFWVIQSRKERRERKKFFEENGGHQLEELISQHRSGFEILKLFTADELNKATDNYHESRILGQGGQGTVYKGVVMNSRVVAIKKAKHLDRSQVNDFINEIVILSRINHKNVVKLIGCCLETELPLLVYEFVTNGTLSQHLHDGDGCSTAALSTWGARLRVAAEAAGALSYLHYDVAIPIYHRDVKSANILLDENYTAKVSDFGASRVIPVDQTQLNTLVQGTFGYIDPEYFHTSQLTEKSDVYSFGVVLAELLTGMKAISFDKLEKDRNLSMVFAVAVKEDRVLQIIDERILNEGNASQIREAALLASRCLKVRGDERPTMKEVVLQLEGILRASDTHPWINQEKEDFRETEYLLGDGYVDSAETGSISAIVSEDTMKSQLASFHIADAR
ncbi:hypothetical protein SAY86_003178 [Trapa natans]|uniref:Uncharacterized protein n=1 Tax=Trapa natans TaxID=22666 RepID=A0AAN7LKD9_TRANT|nr:hypothetical protein SAY86_003178 [Trapa natans]